MTDAIRDQNHIPTKLAVLNTDTVQGTNLIRIAYNPVSNGIAVNTTDTISFTMVSVDPQDQNYVDCWLYQGSDGKLYPAVADSSGTLLIDM